MHRAFQKGITYGSRDNFIQRLRIIGRGLEFNCCAVLFLTDLDGEEGNYGIEWIFVQVEEISSLKKRKKRIKKKKKEKREKMWN